MSFDGWKRHAATVIEKQWELIGDDFHDAPYVELMADVIKNFRHFCDDQGIDFESVVVLARTQYREDRADADSPKNIMKIIGSET